MSYCNVRLKRKSVSPNIKRRKSKVILRHKDKNTISVSVMNIYLFLIYSLFSLIYLYISTIAYTIMLMLYALIQSYTPLFFSISLIKPYLFITFHYLSIAFPKVWSDIPPLLFLVISHHFLVSIIFYCLLYPTVI